MCYIYHIFLAFPIKVLIIIDWRVLLAFHQLRTPFKNNILKITPIISGKIKYFLLLLEYFFIIWHPNFPKRKEFIFCWSSCFSWRKARRTLEFAIWCKMKKRTIRIKAQFWIILSDKNYSIYLNFFPKKW